MGTLRSPEPADSLYCAPLWESAFYCSFSTVKSISLCHSRVMALVHIPLYAQLENISYDLCYSRSSIFGVSIMEIWQ